MIDESQIKVDVFQNGYNNPSVRVTHLPTGIVVRNWTHASVAKNRLECLRDLVGKLKDREAVE